MKILLGTLKDKGGALASFLEPRVGAKPELSGDSIEIEDSGVREGVKPRQVKAYIKRFLFMNGVRRKYRVFVNGRELTIQEIELGEEEEEGKEKKKGEEKPAEEKAEGEPKAEAPPAEEPEAAKEEPEEKAKPKKAAAKKPRAPRKKGTKEA